MIIITVWDALIVSVTPSMWPAWCTERCCCSAHGHFVCYSIRVPPCVYRRSAATAAKSERFYVRGLDVKLYPIWFQYRTVQTIVVCNTRTCRCGWRSQKLGVHWVSQSSSFWPRKNRKTSAVPYRSADGRGTKSLKQVLCPVLWTTWSNGTVKMTFRKKWTSRKVRATTREGSSVVWLPLSRLCYLLFLLIRLNDYSRVIIVFGLFMRIRRSDFPFVVL